MIGSVLSFSRDSDYSIDKLIYINEFAIIWDLVASSQKSAMVLYRHTHNFLYVCLCIHKHEYIHLLAESPKSENLPLITLFLKKIVIIIILDNYFPWVLI